MALRTSYGDGNIIVEVPLDVIYTTQIIVGSWSYTTALGGAGYYYRMRESHRYATKRFRYVGMTFGAAKSCRDELKLIFTRSFHTQVWNGATAQWNNVPTANSVCMASVELEENEDGSYDVVVNVKEDDMKYGMENESFDPSRVFAVERLRTYGSDGHGNEDETEP